MVEALTKEKKQGLVGTITVHLILLFIFIFFGLKYQVPEPTSGISLNFGTEEAGTGEIQPTSNELPTPPPPQETNAASTPEVSEKVMTNDNPDAISVKSNPEEIERNKKEAEEIERNKKEAEEAERLEREAEEKRLAEEAERKRQEEFRNKINGAFSKNTNDVTSQGTSGGTGDQGNPNGDENQGSTLPGVGPGQGPAGLNGSGRTWNEVKPQGVQNEQGKVEVLVFVDSKGNVTKASIHKSNNSALNSNALTAAKKWKFSEHPELGSGLQKIIIPFIFTF